MNALKNALLAGMTCVVAGCASGIDLDGEGFVFADAGAVVDAGPHRGDGGSSDGGTDAADAGNEDAGAPPPVVNCFPEGGNDNLEGMLAFAGAGADGALTCAEQDILSPDGAGAGLAFAGTGSTSLGGQAVTACVTVDMGARCATSDHIGLQISSAVAGETCGDAALFDQCDVEASCSGLPGASVLVFAGDSLDDQRFVARVGGCGEGQLFQTLTPLTAFSDVNGLDAVRYLTACRPSAGCSAEHANISVDVLLLTHRE